MRNEPGVAWRRRATRDGRCDAEHRNEISILVHSEMARRYPTLSVRFTAGVDEGIGEAHTASGLVSAGRIVGGVCRPSAPPYNSKLNLALCRVEGFRLDLAPTVKSPSLRVSADDR